ncbi:MAG: CDP-archaeol synthase [Clostridiales bacterium]|nr:CDP-archaeol synthase [Clostridiales bacterium]
MKTRIITAIVALAVFAPILYFSDTWPFVAFACVVSLLASYEILKCASLDKEWFLSIPTMLVFTFIPFCTRYVFVENSAFLRYVCVVLLIYMFYVFAVAVFSKGKIQITDACLVFMMNAYACAGFCSMVFLRDLEGAGMFMFPLLFIGAWVTDTGAYFVGVTLGKHKLIPDVSPKKSVEGAVGGLLITTLVFLLYGLFINKVFDHQVNYAGLFIMGLLVAVVSMIGDLIASLVKRHYGVKDFGTLFPGHGGVLDRFDSILASSLFIFVLCNLSDYFILIQ